MRRLLALVSFVLVSGSAMAKTLTPFEKPWKNNPQTDAVYKMSDHPSGVFIMEFFANFCGPCNENAPNVDAMAEHYADEPRVQVLDVGIDSDDREIRRWIATHNPNHPVLKDVSRATWKELGGQYIPTMAVTNCRGEVAFQYTGVWSSSVKAQIQQTVDRLLTEQCE